MNSTGCAPCDCMSSQIPHFALLLHTCIQHTTSSHVATQLGSSFVTIASAQSYMMTAGQMSQIQWLLWQGQPKTPLFPSAFYSLELDHEVMLQTWLVTKDHRCWADELDTKDCLFHVRLSNNKPWGCLLPSPLLAPSPPLPTSFPLPESAMHKLACDRRSLLVGRWARFWESFPPPREGPPLPTLPLDARRQRPVP